MILRIGHAIATEASGQEAWQAFAKTQQADNNFTACISQPAHAALAARLAAGLRPSIFGSLPSEVIDTIGRHDSGWGEPDLAALEFASEKPPQSFVTYPSEGAVNAWRNSIREAEARSPLAGILTSRHFCLLAPRDSDPYHDAFIEQEDKRRNPQETASPHSCDDLDRFTAALGFCDLLSLCLCSGLSGTVQMPLAHAAEPASHHAQKVTVSFANETTPDQTIRFSQPVMASGTSVYADGWLLVASKSLTSHRFHWTID
jgi:hypothetical protein